MKGLRYWNMKEKVQRALNIAADISVRGQDVLRMAEVLSLLQQELNEDENKKEEKR